MITWKRWGFGLMFTLEKNGKGWRFDHSGSLAMLHWKWKWTSYEIK